MQYLYAPGCAVMAYKPELADRFKEIVIAKYGDMDTVLTCCFDMPKIEDGTCIITPCSACAKQYEKEYPNCRVEFFLQTLAECDDFDFPDYGGIEMSIQDTCYARTSPEYLYAVRKLLQRMNIKVVEADKSGSKAKCCGQTFYGKLSNEKVENLMKARADEMPCDDVVVYCASCIMALTVGGKQPRFILDLLFGEPTNMANAAIIDWNDKLKHFRIAHKIE